jgi:hypothetical protein
MNSIENLKKNLYGINSFLNEVDSIAYAEQIKYLDEILQLLNNEKYDLAIVRLNSAELWGGSGSIWESEYGMTIEQKDLFDNIMLKLLETMKEDNIIKKRASSVFNILSKRVS